MTLEEELAKKYVDQTYNGDTDFIDEAENVISWLLRDYAIVPKSQLKELYECYKQHEVVSKEKSLYEAEMIARGSQATMRDIFGSGLFENEK